MSSASLPDPFVWLPVGLESVALRLARADELAFEIGESIGRWSFDDPVNMQQIRDGEEVEMVVSAIRPVPPRVSLLFSEAVNHIRAALDNVVWHLTEREHGALTGRPAILVAMPICDTHERYEAWVQTRVRAGLTSFAEAENLGRKMRALQPFADVDSGVASIGEALAAMTGSEVERVHPLRLMQAYSNEDKHREIRTALGRTFSSDSSRPVLQQDLGARALVVGDVLARTAWGVPIVLEAHTAIMVRRPEPWAAWVNPVKELNALRSYVADVAVPLLITGLHLSSGLPPGIDLNGTQESARDRLKSARNDDAEVRLAPKMMELLRQADERGINVAEVVDRNSGDRRGGE